MVDEYDISLKARERRNGCLDEVIELSKKIELINKDVKDNFTKKQQHLFYKQTQELFDYMQTSSKYGYGVENQLKAYKKIYEENK